MQRKCKELESKNSDLTSKNSELIAAQASEQPGVISQEELEVHCCTSIRIIILDGSQLLVAENDALKKSLELSEMARVVAKREMLAAIEYRQQPSKPDTRVS